MSGSTDFASRVRLLPISARKLLCVIARQAYHGALRSKDPGVATMPEIHEACGLDVDGMYAELRVLREAGLIEVAGQYPFEEIRLKGEDVVAIVTRSEARKVALEEALVDLRFDLLES